MKLFGKGFQEHCWEDLLLFHRPFQLNYFIFSFSIYFPAYYMQSKYGWRSSEERERFFQAKSQLKLFLIKKINLKSVYICFFHISPAFGQNYVILLLYCLIAIESTSNLFPKFPSENSRGVNKLNTFQISVQFASVSRLWSFWRVKTTVYWTGLSNFCQLAILLHRLWEV